MYIYRLNRNKSPLKISGKVAVGVVRDTAENFHGAHIHMGASRGHLCDSSAFLSSTRYYLRKGVKLRTSNLGDTFKGSIRTISPLKILEKREHGCIQGLPKHFKYPLLSQELVKLRTLDFVCNFIRSITTNAH